MTPRRFSFWFLGALLVLSGWLHLNTLLLTMLFSMFALRHLHVMKAKWPAIAIFLVLLVALGFGAVRFAKKGLVAIPKIADQSIPSVIAWAESHDIELPFDDFDSLKAAVLDAVRTQTQSIGNAATMARGASMQVVLFIAGIVAAISMFLSGRIDLDRRDGDPARTPYARYADEISARVRVFYASFEVVMGAQVLISAINATLTVIFMLATGMPHRTLIFGSAFLCGLLPIVGNLISNTIVVCVGFLISPAMALAALVFLVLIHKLEYFLNSKIIGARIRNPLWLTLMGLVLGEHLMGVPGMVLAPVVLNYIKVEASQTGSDSHLSA